jgi:hypothetical protein
MRNRWRNLGIVAGVLLAIGVLVGPLRAWQRTRAARQALVGNDAGQKGLALRTLARARTSQADAIVAAALTGADTGLRNQAAYAISAAHRTDLAEPLRAAWDRESDLPVRSNMIFYWAQLAGPTAEPVLRAMLGSPDIWTVLGAAKGLLRQGHIEAVEPIFWLAADSAARADARGELLNLATPMAAMIGQRLAVADVPTDSWSAEQIGQLQAWWQGHISERLLRDYLAWRADKPDPWQKASMLVHEWKSRFGGFLQMSKSDAARR